MSASVCFAESNGEMEKIIYSEDYDILNEEQVTLDEELFADDFNEDYTYYNVYTEVNEEEAESIALESPEQPSGTLIKTGIEKSYSYKPIEAFNTYWDDSLNFKTILLNYPTQMQTPPSIIHSVHYKFKPDAVTDIYWGHAALSSFNDVSVGFVGKLESSYDTGLKINTRIGGMNIAGAVYDSLETNNPSGGMLLSTDDLSFGKMKGTLKFGGGFYTNEYGQDSSANAVGIFTKYKYNRFGLGIQISGQNRQSAGLASTGASIWLYPEYRLTDSLYIKSKLAGHFGQQYTQEELGITYKPARNNQHDFQVSLNAVLYQGEGVVNKQRLKLSTEFRL